MNIIHTFDLRQFVPAAVINPETEGVVSLSGGVGYPREGQEEVALPPTPDQPPPRQLERARCNAR